MVLKHASQTPLAGERLAQAFAHLPEGLFTNLFLDHATTAALIAERAFDFINFTGSVRGGREIERAAAGTFVGLGLELGGKDPGYVRADANLDAAVDTLMDGAMYNAGQCCCGIERIYVHESLYDALRREGRRLGLRPEARQPARGGDHARPDGDSSASPTPCARQIAEAVAAGATPLVDPELLPGRHRRHAPISRRRSSWTSTTRCG